MSNLKAQEAWLRLQAFYGKSYEAPGNVALQDMSEALYTYATSLFVDELIDEAYKLAELEHVPEPPEKVQAILRTMWDLEKYATLRKTCEEKALRVVLRVPEEKQEEKQEPDYCYECDEVLGQEWFMPPGNADRPKYHITCWDKKVDYELLHAKPPGGADRPKYPIVCWDKKVAKEEAWRAWSDKDMRREYLAGLASSDLEHILYLIGQMRLYGNHVNVQGLAAHHNVLAKRENTSLPGKWLAGGNVWQFFCSCGHNGSVSALEEFYHCKCSKLYKRPSMSDRPVHE